MSTITSFKSANQSQALNAVQHVVTDAAKAKALFLDSVAGTEIGSPEWQERFIEASEGTFFDALRLEGEEEYEHVLNVGALACESIKHYMDSYGTLPSDDSLASAYSAMDIMASDLGANLPEGSKAKAYFDSAEFTQDSTKIEALAESIMLIMPVMLESITAMFCSHIPSARDLSRIYKTTAVSKSNFGDLKKGDELTESMISDMASMFKRFHVLTTTGGTDTTSAGNGLTYDTAAKTAGGVKLPAVDGSVKLIANGKIVAQVVGSQFAGSMEIGGTTYTFSGTADLENGVYAPVTDTNLPAGVQVYVAFEVDIENNPTLIPEVGFKFSYVELTPYELAIRSTATIQAARRAQAVHGLNLKPELIKMQANLLAKSRDNKRLSEMYDYAPKGVISPFDAGSAAVAASGVSQDDYYRTFKNKLIATDSALVTANKRAGAYGYVAGTAMSEFIKRLPTDLFKLAPSYKQEVDVHFLGTLWGKPVFCDPNMGAHLAKSGIADGSSMLLAIAKGKNFGETCYVTGDVTTPVAYNHSVGTDLNKSDTYYQVGIDEIHPDNGHEWLCFLEVENV